MNPLNEPIKSITKVMTPKTCSRFTPISEAVGLMKEMGIGSVIAVESGKIVGMFSERDYVLKIAMEDIDPEKDAINAYMNVNPPTVSLDDPIRKAYQMMTINKDHYLIVVDKKGKLNSILSLRDLVRFVEKKLWEEDQESA